MASAVGFLFVIGRPVQSLCILLHFRFFTNPAVFPGAASRAVTKSLKVIRLYSDVIKITKAEGFGAANASVLCNKEAATKQHDLDPHRFYASLPEVPFCLAERHLASPFLTLPTNRSLLKRGPRNGAIFSGSDTRPGIDSQSWCSRIH
jgi:hypothetical protein